MIWYLLFLFVVLMNWTTWFYVFDFCFLKKTNEFKKKLSDGLDVMIVIETVCRIDLTSLRSNLIRVMCSEWCTCSYREILRRCYTLLTENVLPIIMIILIYLSMRLNCSARLGSWLHDFKFNRGGAYTLSCEIRVLECRFGYDVMDQYAISS